MKEINFNNQVKIRFYFTEPDNFILSKSSMLFDCLKSIQNNTSRYDKDLFKNMIIEVYENNYSNSPFNNNHAVGYSEAWQNKILIKESVFSSIDSLSDLLSHEIGHYRAYKTGFDDTKHFMRKELDRIRSIDSNAKISVSELVAEDFYYYYGVDKYSKGVFRTNQEHPHLNPDNVKGLKAFYDIFGIIYKFTTENFNLSYGQIKNTKFTYDNNYCSVEFEYHLFGLFSMDRYKIDINGIYKRNGFNGRYDLIKAI